MSHLPSIQTSHAFLWTQPVDLAVFLLTPRAWKDHLEGLEELDASLDHQLFKAAALDGFKAEKDQSFEIYTFGKVKAQRIALIGLGDLSESAYLAYDLRKAAAKASRLALEHKAQSLWLHTPDFGPLSNIEGEKLVALGAALGAYRFDQYLRESEEKTLENIWVRGQGQGIEIAQSLAEAVYWARDLSNEPPNVMTPEALARQAQSLEDLGLSVEVWDAQTLKAKGMNLIYAVGKGSDQEPWFIHMHYEPKSKPLGRVSFVGKGITFDTGGYSIKSWRYLLNMHLDMGGAAAVMALAKYVAQMGSKWSLDFIIAAAENNISDRSYKPTEIIKGYGGKTVEIVNTDAEGRLVLADALAYATELNPDYIVDLATLTGASLVALGENTAAVLGNDKTLRSKIVEAGHESGEKIWPLPLDDELKKHLKSEVADIRNCTTAFTGGVIMGGLFLKTWIKEQKWAHIDLAGPAMADRDTTISPAGGTGFGVVTLVSLLNLLERS